MNSITNDRLQRTADAVEDWLRPDNHSLKQAIDRSVEEGLFSFPDIRHRLLSLKGSVTRETLAEWVGQTGLDPGELKDLRLLTLQAGNLPMAGIQDLLVCALTGCSLSGKLSRKDPWIPATFLEKLEAHKLLEDSVWSTSLNDLAGKSARFILFSGSSVSVPPVRERIHELNLAGSESSFLIRSAHYSLAWLPSTDPAVMEDLTEAVFRYGGKGCRSIGMVVAPFDLDSVKCDFTDYIESFWLRNPQHEKPPPSLWFRYAYNKAAGYAQSWLDDFLIEQTLMLPEQEFVLHWVQGDEKEAANIARRFSAGLQSVYVPSEEIDFPECGRTPEALSTAQNPPVNWKPDGTDPLVWIVEEAKRR